LSHRSSFWRMDGVLVMLGAPPRRPSIHSLIEEGTRKEYELSVHACMMTTGEELVSFSVQVPCKASVLYNKILKDVPSVENIALFIGGVRLEYFDEVESKVPSGATSTIVDVVNDHCEASRVRTVEFAQEAAHARDQAFLEKQQERGQRISECQLYLDGSIGDIDTLMNTLPNRKRSCSDSDGSSGDINISFQTCRGRSYENNRRSVDFAEAAAVDRECRLENLVVPGMGICHGSRAREENEVPDFVYTFQKYKCRTSSSRK